MSNLPIMNLNQDYVILNTYVTVGKSYSSKGWALSRQDIHDWIPIEEFERDCKIIVNNITSDAILRFNPRLFYKNDELSLYLKELYDKGLKKNKIPMSIKINKNNFFSKSNSFDEYLNLNYIETELFVGKSYRSKGWQLSKKIVSKLFPVEQYCDEYSIYIDDIESNAKLNLQFRLFYKNDKLSEYLEHLYLNDSKSKIFAKIVFNENHVQIEENSIEIKTNDVVESQKCSICGKDYYFDDESLDKEGKFSDYCPNCIEKIIILSVYNNIKNFSFSNYVKKEFVKEYVKSNFNEIWELLVEYKFLIPFGNLFKLNDNEVICNQFSKYLPDYNLKPKLSSKERNKNKILELIGEEKRNDEFEKRICNVCGELFDNFNLEKCESCNDKELATEYLHEIVTKVPYGKSFSKFNIINLGIKSLDADLFLNKLLKYNLIFIESDIFYKLNNISFLNDFVKKYSNSPYELKINYLDDNSDVLKISKEDLNSEEKIDDIIKWKYFADYISFKKGQYGFISVQFKQEGNFLYSKGFGTSYEAKLSAISYLESLGKIAFIVEEEIKLEFV